MDPASEPGMEAGIGRLRVAAQRLVVAPGTDRPAPAEVVRWMTCLQGQDFPGVLASVALRSGSTDVTAMFASREVVRSWPMRGTLHLVPAEDLHWMLSVTSERLLAGAATRREYLGIDQAILDTAESVAVEALEGGHSLSRADLLALWEPTGILEVPQRGYHLIWWLSQRGITCWGPVEDGDQHLVLLDEWVPRPRRLEREEALAEWALRYFRSHGPATRQDFQHWLGVTAADAKAGVAGAREHLEVVLLDGVEHLMDPQTPALLEAAREPAAGVLLLPGFDEFLLGYKDRSAVLAPEHFEKIVPGRNGMFRPTVVDAGRVVGTWKRAGSGRNLRIEAEPFEAYMPATEAALSGLFAAFPRR